MTFNNKTIFISGASRGIGKAIALRLAREGANIIVAAKSVEENPKLGGTIYSAAEEIEKAGGSALAVQCDIRFEDQIENAIKKGIEKFGGLDIVINNASAINLSNTDQTETKKFDLMLNINIRGTFLVVKHSIPNLKKSSNPHILTLSPPINLNEKWFKSHIGYTITKYSMSMMAISWAHEYKKDRIASNALWPKTTIDTAAVRNLLGGEKLARMSRTPEIIADSAALILASPSDEMTGNCFIDEELLSTKGFTDFGKYSVEQGAKLYKDLFVD